MLLGILIGTIVAALAFVSLSFVDNYQLSNVQKFAAIDDPEALAAIYEAQEGKTLMTPEGESFVLSEKYTEDEFIRIRSSVEQDGKSTPNPEYTDYVVPARQACAKAITHSSPRALILFIALLLAALIAMATFRSPAVALMPDVTIKPLRSKANAVINLLNNTFKLGDKIPALGIVLSAMSFAVSVLTLFVLWKLSAAVPRFRKAVYFNLLPLIVLPFVTLFNISSGQEWIMASDVSAILVVLIILLGLVFLFATLAAYHQLTACAEAFDGADDAMAAKWRSLCTWQVVIIGCFGAFLTLLLLLGLSSASFFYFYNGGMIVLLLLILAIAIALGVVEIIELVYLNRSAKLFE